MLSLKQNLINKESLINPTHALYSDGATSPPAPDLSALRPADILALVPALNAEHCSLIYLSNGEIIGSNNRVSYILSLLASSVDKSVTLIRRRVATELGKRRNIPLPLSLGCVLFPIESYTTSICQTGLGYINATKPLLISSSNEGNTVFALHSGVGLKSRWKPAVSKMHLDTARSLNCRLLLEVGTELDREKDNYLNLIAL